MFELKVILLSLLCLPFIYICIKLTARLMDDAFRKKDKKNE